MLFGLLYLGFVIAFVVIAFSIGKRLKSNKLAFRFYVAVIMLLPIWFFGGHKLYPSYSEYRSLCSGASSDFYAQIDSAVDTKYKKAWIVENRLSKISKLYLDKNGKTVAERTDYHYYPFGKDFKFVGAGGGHTPRKSCFSSSW